MKLDLKDNNGLKIEVGDEVTILLINDDSGNATDLYGVEPQLNAWVDIIYVDSFTGIVEFCKDRLMFVIKHKNKVVPLSTYIRYGINNSNYDALTHSNDETELKELAKEYNLSEFTPESITDYIIKTHIN